MTDQNIEKENEMRVKERFFFFKVEKRKKTFKMSERVEDDWGTSENRVM